MAKFSLYNIPLRSLSEGSHEFTYVLDNGFFKLINDGDSEQLKGSVNVKVDVKHTASTFEFKFKLDGEVSVPCDRCLDDLPIEIDCNNKLIVKFGKEYSEESDEIVIIPEDEGEINIAWFLYEFVALSLPIKRVHPQGKCNRLMSSKLNKHKVTSENDNDEPGFEEDVDGEISEKEGDSRWDSLKDLNFEN